MGDNSTTEYGEPRGWIVRHFWPRKSDIVETGTVSEGQPESEQYHIQLDENFAKAKRNLFWISSGLILLAFSTLSRYFGLVALPEVAVVSDTNSVLMETIKTTPDIGTITLSFTNIVLPSWLLALLLGTYEFYLWRGFEYQAQKMRARNSQLLMSDTMAEMENRFEGLEKVLGDRIAAIEAIPFDMSEKELSDFNSAYAQIKDRRAKANDDPDLEAIIPINLSDAAQKLEKFYDLKGKPPKSNEAAQNGIKKQVTSLKEIGRLFEKYRVGNDNLKSELERLHTLASKTKTRVGPYIDRIEAEMEKLQPLRASVRSVHQSIGTGDRWKFETYDVSAGVWMHRIAMISMLFIVLAPIASYFVPEIIALGSVQDNVGSEAGGS